MKGLIRQVSGVGIASSLDVCSQLSLKVCCQFLYLEIGKNVIVFIRIFRNLIDYWSIKDRDSEVWGKMKSDTANQSSAKTDEIKMKSWLIGKDSDAGKDWGQEEKGVTEDEMVGWHHWLHGREFQQTPGDREGQGSLVCCSPWESQRVGHDLETEWQQWGWGKHWNSIVVLLSPEKPVCWSKCNS